MFLPGIEGVRLRCTPVLLESEQGTLLNLDVPSWASRFACYVNGTAVPSGILTACYASCVHGLAQKKSVFFVVVPVHPHVLTSLCREREEAQVG